MKLVKTRFKTELIRELLSLRGRIGGQDIIELLLSKRASIDRKYHEN